MAAVVASAIVSPKIFSSPKTIMAEPEGFEPSIGLYNPITV
jgi:hypothetical protein